VIADGVVCLMDDVLVCRSTHAAINSQRLKLSLRS